MPDEEIKRQEDVICIEQKGFSEEIVFDWEKNEEECLRREERVKKTIELAYSKVRSRELLSVNEMVEDLTKDLPDTCQDQVMRDHRVYERHGEMTKKLGEVVIETQSLSDKALAFLQKARAMGMSEDEIKNLEDEFLAIKKKAEDSQIVAKRKVEEGEVVVGERDGKKLVKVDIAQQTDRFVKRATADSANKVREAYMEKGLNMANGEFARLETIQAVDAILKENPELEDLKKVARVIFDLNGLKVVNDWTENYKQGNAYLGLVKEALRDPEVQKFAEDNGLEYADCREGGDEFSAIIKSEKPLTKEALNGFRKLVQEKLQGNKKASEIVDFNQENILLHWGRVNKEEWEKMDGPAREAKLAEIKKSIPEGFEYRARASVGIATLYDSLMDAEQKEENILSEGDDYTKVLHKLMGGIFSTGDRIMHRKKEGFKDSLARSNDPKDRMLSEIYTRTDKERELNKIIEGLRLGIFVFSDSVKNIKEMVKSGAISKEEAYDTIEKLEEELSQKSKV